MTSWLTPARVIALSPFIDVETLAFARTGGPELLRPLGEVEFANGIAAMSASGFHCDFHVCAAIVGFAGLRFGNQVAGLLDAALALAPDRFRGVRQITIEHPSDAPFRFVTNRPAPGMMKHPNFRDGYRELAAAWKPYIETTIEAFGAGRCLMESNFPPDGRSAGFALLWNALKRAENAQTVDATAGISRATSDRHRCADSCGGSHR